MDLLELIGILATVTLLGGALTGTIIWLQRAQKRWLTTMCSHFVSRLQRLATELDLRYVGPELNQTTDAWPLVLGEVEGWKISITLDIHFGEGDHQSLALIHVRRCNPPSTTSVKDLLRLKDDLGPAHALLRGRAKHLDEMEDGVRVALELLERRWFGFDRIELPPDLPSLARHTIALAKHLRPQHTV